jgi:hypothetical protein
MVKKQNVHGEGNYAATRKYNESLRRFLRSGRVGRAAHDAAVKPSTTAPATPEAPKPGEDK